MLSQRAGDTVSSTTRPRVLITESAGFSPAALTTLESFAEVSCQNLSRAELLSSVSDTEVLWVRLRHRIDQEIMDAAPRLKAIVTPTTGLNHIAESAANQRGISILSLKGEAAFLKDVRATAELSIGLILSLLRNIPSATHHAKSGGWNRDLFKGREIRGKTVGIVGYGRLGRIVARYLNAFDAHVLATDPNVGPEETDGSVQMVSLSQLLGESDIVSIHVNLCDHTENFFAAEQFEQMKPGALLINTARGELIDECSLLDYLRSGRLAGAAVDVVTDESRNDDSMECHPVLKYARENANLIVTPHIGGCTHESMHMTEEFLAQKLAKWVNRSQA